MIILISHESPGASPRLPAGRQKRTVECLQSTRVALFVVGLFTITKGVFYFPALLGPEGVPAVERWGHPLAWAAVWITVGLAAVGAALVRRSISLSVGLLFSLYFLWGMMYLFSWMYGPSERGYVTANTYLLISALLFWLFASPRRVPVTIDAVKEGEE